MKKQLFLMSMVAIALASCSNDETVAVSNPQAALSLRPVMSNVTRGEAVTITNLNEFKVKLNPATDAIKDHDAAFTETVASVDGGATWATANPIYWGDADDALVKATAWAPASLTESDGQIEYTVPATVADQKDVVVAYNEGTKSANATIGIPLNFKHVLSQIVVKATNQNTAEREIKVVGAKVVANYDGGTLTLPELPAAWGAWSSTLTATTANCNKYEVTIPATVLGNTATDLTDGNIMLLMPQQLTAWDLTDDATYESKGAYIAVKCQISSIATNGTKTQIWPKTGGNEYAYAAIPVNTKWEAGKKYVYTLNFYQGTGKAGVIDPDVPTGDRPLRGETGSETAAATGSDVDAVSPAPSVPLFFTVTVEEWSEATATDLNMK